MAHSSPCQEMHEVRLVQQAVPSTTVDHDLGCCSEASIQR